MPQPSLATAATLLQPRVVVVVRVVVVIMIMVVEMTVMVAVLLLLLTMLVVAVVVMLLLLVMLLVVIMLVLLSVMLPVLQILLLLPDAFSATDTTALLTRKTAWFQRRFRSNELARIHDGNDLAGVNACTCMLCLNVCV